MSKRIIAGLGVVAGLAVALAPVATFATGQNTDREVVDNLQITIEESCAFGHNFTDDSITDLTGVTRTAGTPGTWGTGTGAFAEGTSEDTASATMEAGTKATSFATTEMTVYCNNATGYQVKLTATDLESNDDASHPIVPAGSTSIASMNVATDTTSRYNITPTLTSATSATMGTGFTSGSEATGLNTTANTLFFSNAGATDNAGDKVNVVYGVGLIKTQGAGTYTGSVTYTLTKGQA